MLFRDNFSDSNIMTSHENIVRCSVLLNQQLKNLAENDTVYLWMLKLFCKTFFLFSELKLFFEVFFDFHVRNIFTPYVFLEHAVLVQTILPLNWEVNQIFTAKS